MCRLFGMTAGHQRVPATFWLLDARDSLDLQSRRNPDGTGLGTFDRDGRPVVEKAPIAAYEDRDFATEARHRESTTFVAHVRHASTGRKSVENTHPFLFDGRLGAHNGVVAGLAELEAHLGTAMDWVRGQTDSERILALIALETRRAGGDVDVGLTTALGWIGAHLPLYAVNLVLATPHDLWAVRYPQSHELWLLRRGGDREPLAHRSSTGTRIESPQAGKHPVVVVASEPMDDDDWELLPPNTVTHIDGSLHVRRVVELDPPVHLLTVAELGAAAASQSPGPTSGPS